MSHSRTETALSTRDLDIGYGNGTKVTAIAKGLNLDLRPGEFVCLLGPNGAGKSTLIRTLSGMQAPLSGQIHFQGKPFQDIAPRHRARMVSVVLTDTHPAGLMDAYTLVSLGRHPYSGWFGSLSKQDRNKIDWAIEAVGAQALAQRQVSELSDGERQKVSIARALAQESKVMLLDEPTAFLDLPRRVELMTLLRDLAHQENLALMLSTHDLDLALRFADKLWVLSPEGALIQGYPEAIALSDEFAEVFRSDKIDWDPAIGSFRAHPTPCLSVTIDGDGLVGVWTKRALERLGFGVTLDGSKPSLTIEVVNGSKWIVDRKDTKHSFDSIDALITWVIDQDWS